MIKRRKKLMSLTLVAMIMSSTCVSVFAAENDGWTEAKLTEAADNGVWEAWCTEWETIKNDWTQLSITPGSDATELNFAWYSNEGEVSPKVRISKNDDMTESVEFDGNQSAAVPGYLSNKVTISALEEDTTYYYSYGTNGKWSEPTEINTQSTDRFGFFLVGDPQIGSSLNNIAYGEDAEQGQDNSVRNDTFNWNDTVNKALSIMPNASFMISAGDQVSIRNKKATTEEALAYSANEIEYAGYLSPRALQSLPVATTLGNHDAVSGNYSYHFNNPNASTLGSTVGGGNYYYTYGNTLFIMLNTNNKNIAEHEEFIEQAISENPDVTWKVVTLHQDIYGSGEHSNEPEIAELRYGLVPIFEENGVDVVLTGHDHTYARSKILSGGVKDEDTFLTDEEYEEFFNIEFESDYETLVEDEKYLNYLKSIQDKNAVVTDLNIESGKVVDPDGILYITANSASGSKYYNIVPRQQEYIASRWQEDVPTFSTINVDEVSLSISTYRTDTMEKIDETYTIVKALDNSSLLELIAAAESKEENKYTVSSWSQFEAALINAKAVSNQSDATSDILSQAYTDLNATMNSLVERGDTENLITTINLAKELIANSVIGEENGNYPMEAKTKLEEAIEEAEKIAISDDISEIEVDEAIAKLSEAIEEFKNKQIVILASDSNDENKETVRTEDDKAVLSGAGTGSSTNNSSNTKKGSVSNVNTGDKGNGFAYGVIGIAFISLIVLNYKKIRKIVNK